MAKIEVQTVRPFSNGTEFMMWLDSNCDQCVKSYKPTNGQMPDYKTTQRLVNLGMECKLKLAIDFSAITGEVSEDIARQVGWTPEKHWPEACMMFSDDENDGWKPAPKKPKDAPDCQMCLPFAINEIVMTEEKELV